MGAAVRGKLIRRLKVKELKDTVPIPNELKGSFRDAFDVPLVVETGRNRRRVCLAVSSGCELVVPDWLKQSILAGAAANDEVAIYLSTRPLWFVEGEQDEAIAAVVRRHGRPAEADASATTPVSLGPRLPNLDRVSDVLDIAEGDAHR